MIGSIHMGAGTRFRQSCFETDKDQRQIVVCALVQIIFGG